MFKFPKTIQQLITQFQRLPGIGPKTAERMVFWVLRQPKSFLFDFAQALQHVHDSVTHCSVCHVISEHDPCERCKDTTRDKTVICVVAESHDLSAIESIGTFTGSYHVLNGVLSPIHGITPDKLTIDSLVAKIQKEPIKEVILALNPDIEGDATTNYLNNLLKPLKNIAVTRLAKGLPIGSDIEYADEVTLLNSLENRKEV